MTYLAAEWDIRRSILNCVLDILSDGKPRLARQIMSDLENKGIFTPKKIVNSILFSEGRRYVSYDKLKYTYQLRLQPDDDTNDYSQVIINQDHQSLSKEKNDEPKFKYIGVNNEFVFIYKKSTSSAFFEVASKSRTIEIIINEEHELFSILNEIFFPEKITEISQKCSKIIGSLLIAWAKYENELPDGIRKNRAEEARIDWGKHVDLSYMLDV